MSKPARFRITEGYGPPITTGAQTLEAAKRDAWRLQSLRSSHLKIICARTGELISECIDGIGWVDRLPRKEIAAMDPRL